MPLSTHDVEHIAALARLALTDQEKQLFAEQLSGILAYIEQLQAVDTTAVPPTAQVSGLIDVARPDVVAASDAATRAAILTAVPQRAGDFIKVKGVFEE
ncbi:MAG: Asp-tRNA(Asn)/Glu-tRNA(Gln) amidotransferase subunit GatC [Patescibacteria group bacterium]